ncbi:sigma-70 region 4 domain-containing protein [Novosphingobium sp. SG707]|uniref:sigma-70 region 4 domain-containing protein n=1 Tax=Novosphingobium sp. SG707 TaxID=2586996 RepID=UPI0014450296|nr:sigma-70 region 4 domain-containing protein [Novosphingobium sp. SG707]NKJ00396.1 DNA-directed RNA polymerase specialized sigma24 family protein [Novosphingobium sp. SG707]
MSPAGFAAILFGLWSRLARHITPDRVSRVSAMDTRQFGAARGDPLPKGLNWFLHISRKLKSLSAAKDDRQLRFCNALDVLPEPTRVIYLLHSRDDLDFPAIASLMGITIDRVQLELARALKLLCEAIDEE